MKSLYVLWKTNALRTVHVFSYVQWDALICVHSCFQHFGKLPGSCLEVDFAFWIHFWTISEVAEVQKPLCGAALRGTLF